MKTTGFAALLAVFPIVAAADALPLALPLHDINANTKRVITCTGKAWVELAPGPLVRDAVIADIALTDRMNGASKLLACDDGAGHTMPVTGVISAVQVAHAGQTALKDTFRVIVLYLPEKPGQWSSVIFPVDSALGDTALISRSGKGLIRVDHDNGLVVYPPSYKLAKVSETTFYVIKQSAKAPKPCEIVYVSDDPDPGAQPKKILHSKLDCATLLVQKGADAIFAGDIPT